MTKGLSQDYTNVGDHIFAKMYSFYCSGDYWGDFDYCDSIAIVESTIVILLR